MANQTIPETRFIEHFAQLQFTRTYDQYRELQTKLTPEEIDLYKKAKKEFDELTGQTNQFTRKVTQNAATDEDYTTQRERDNAIKAIQLDSKVAQFLSLENDIVPECQRALMIRRTYITDFNPENRKIRFNEGNYDSPAPEIFRNLKNILKADGATITESDAKEFDDRIYRGGNICGRTDGEDTYPILFHAERTTGFALFFIAYRPLVEYCSGDPELKTARELQRNGKNVIIVTSEGSWGPSIMRFL